jgi:uncharacterized FAD-dependent dehydrogenase
MQETIQLQLTPEQAAVSEQLKFAVASSLSIESKRIVDIKIVKKSIDARGRFPKVNLTVWASIDEMPIVKKNESFHPQDVSKKEHIIIVGAGPAGLFAALRLIELGLCPIVFERGKEVSERKKDIASLSKNVSLNVDSNYCFGEGGAGTFSDGKLYTRSKKKGNATRVFELFNYFGAQDEILYEAHPHIGTDKLPLVIKSMRESIIQSGGQVFFEKKVTDLLLEDNRLTGIQTDDGTSYTAKAVILATGHSARDINELLHAKDIALEAKGFAMGVRVEHPQDLIDDIQYRGNRGEYLPAASYNLVEQVEDRGVYSFCMCPGGHIVPAATDNNEIVVNGMSASQRNSPYANSGIVVEIRSEDLGDWSEHGVMAGLRFQEHVEQLCYNNNGGLGQVAPAQGLADFVKGRLSLDLPACSYLPGLLSSPLHFWLPEMISKRLRAGFKKFDAKMHGYLTNEAVVVGVETRSSSPLRIPRDRETLQHITVEGLYPCGEGAGYAGGITSSAIDGMNCAEKIADNINK